MKRFTSLWISTLVYFVGVVIFSFYITDSLTKYRLKKEEIANTLSYKERLLSPWEWIPGNTIGEDKILEWGELEMQAKAFYNDALVYTLLLGVLLAFYVVFNNLFYRHKKENYQVYGLIMNLCSISFLFLALQSPFLEVMAYTKDMEFNIPFDLNLNEIDFIGSLGLGEFHYEYDHVIKGRVYYLYQNKSVLELIKLLYTGGNYIIAILVLIVSILFPLYKFTLSLVVLLAPQKKSSIGIYKSIRNLGKWSMIDVFTTAILLAHFAYTNMATHSVDTGSETLIGLYYFLIFVALSINSGQYLKKAMKKAQNLGDVSTLDE